MSKNTPQVPILESKFKKPKRRKQQNKSFERPKLFKDSEYVMMEQKFNELVREVVKNFVNSPGVESTCGREYSIDPTVSIPLGGVY